jgi:hypothetical protein
MDTNDKLSSAIGSINFEGMPSNGNVVDVKITLNWTFYVWLTLYKTGNKNSYIFDIGDSFVKNRMSLFLDEHGFINWRIIDENYTIHSIRKDFNPFIGKRNLIVIVKQKNSFKLYVDKENYMEFNLTNSNFSIKSTDFYLGSDINGENKFYSEEKPTVKDFTN